MTKTALAIRHIHFEDVGTYAAPFAEAGYAIRYLEAGVDDLSAVDALDPDLLVVLGGPIGAYEEETFPFLRDELRLLAARAASDKPVLGMCLGAQLLARALGAPVGPGPAAEIGWGKLTLTAEGRAGPLRHLDGVTMFHWHGDVAGLPAGASLLATTEICTNQAFARGKSLLGLQFHGEVAAAPFERWLIGYSGDIARSPDLSVAGLRAAAAEFGPEAAAAGRRMIGEWLAGLGA